MAERRAAAKVRREAKAAAELSELKTKATAITAEYRARVLTPSVIEGFIGEIINSVVHRVPTASPKLFRLRYPTASPKLFTERAIQFDHAK